jgi:hypothetical protein
MSIETTVNMSSEYVRMLQNICEKYAFSKSKLLTFLLTRFLKRGTYSVSRLKGLLARSVVIVYAGRLYMYRFRLIYMSNVATSVSFVKFLFLVSLPMLLNYILIL